MPFDIATLYVDEVLLSPGVFSVAESEWEAKYIRSAFNLTSDSSSIGAEEQLHLRDRNKVVLH